MWFSITTLGCKVNQYDGESLAATLESLGLRRAGAVGSARPRLDLVVVNTCCVTAVAMRKSRQALRRAVRRAPGASVLVAGCYGDYDAARIRALLAEMGVPAEKLAVVGHHGDLAAWVEHFARGRRRRPAPGRSAAGEEGPRTESGREDGWMNASCDARITASPTSIKTRRLAAVKAHMPGTDHLAPLRRFAARQRAFVKVQDGCDAFCTYCIVPYTRPRVRSRPVDDILDECRRLAAAGHKEIVLCGVFLGAFGRETAVRRRWDDTPSRLPELLRRVCQIEGLWRVRLSSIEPGDVTEDLLAALAELPPAAPHLHLPLQSGAPAVLRRMNRQYTADQFRQTVDRVRDALDRPALTTDIIVGFPGESEDDFAETLALAETAGFAKIHAFPFSAVEGTAAWRRRREAAPPAVVKSRLTRLAALETRLADRYRRRFVGEALEALVEPPRAASPHRHAMTDRYLTVWFPAPSGADGDGLTGRVVRLHIDEATRDGLSGRLLDPTE